MALTTIAAAIAAARAVGQDIPWHKTTLTTGVALTPHSLWVGAGWPAVTGTYGATGKANGRVLTKTSTGGGRFVDAPPTGDTRLCGVGMCPGAATALGTAYLVDRIADVSIAHAEATGAITGCDATSRLPGVGTYEEGCQIWAYVGNALSAASNVFTLDYTDQDGNAATTPNITTVASAVTNRSVNALMFQTLAAGSTGVRSIDAITAVSGAGTGTICLALVRVLATVPMPLLGTVIEKDFIAENPGMVKIYDDTCFDWIIVPTGAIANGTLMTGSISLVSG